jgi:hypothetical protein
LRRIAGLVACAVVSLAAGRAHAVCTASACDATALTANPACCSAASCTIDGTLTVSGPTCSFDFGGRNLTVSGTVSAQGKTITLKAKSMKLTGLIDVRGLGGASAGNVTIVTTGGTALAYTQQGGTSAVIDASSTAASGGQIVIQADGPVAFSTGNVKADGAAAQPGGIVDVSTTSGDINVQIQLSAIQGAPPPPGQRGGEVDFTTPDDLVVGGSGKLIADDGSVSVVVGGMASFADGSVVQANLGGDISMVAGSLQANGVIRSVDEFGTVDLTATSGPMVLSRLSEGITIGDGDGVSLTTETEGVGGTLTMDTPILASGASVDIEAAGPITISKKIQTTGILDSGAGEVLVSSDGNVHVTKAIVASDVYSAEDIEIDAGGTMLIEGSIESKGGLDADGGDVTLNAGSDITLQTDIDVNVAGADSSSGGSIDIEAGGNLFIATAVILVSDASPTGTAGNITLLAGVDELGAEKLPGTLTLQGDISGHGHDTVSGAIVDIGGCGVSIPSGAIIDVTGDAGSMNLVSARTNLSIAGTLKATAANILTFRTGTTPTLTGVFVPARSAGSCVGGTVTANGCSRPPCTGDNVPSGCLNPCPQCGDNSVDFPETCEIGGNGGQTFCDGSDFCDAHCRVRHCTDTNPCTINSCDPTLGCQIALEPNGFTTGCDDNNVCNGVESCQNGACIAAGGTVPSCGDQNPCTDDTCDPVTGCAHTPISGTAPGCTDSNPCNGTETCADGTCQAGTLVTCPPGFSCNPANGMCETSGGCVTPAQCNDGNPCTQDLCVSSVCSNPPVTDGTSCDDGDPCNGVRTCSGGVCQQASPVVCGDACHACNSGTGDCDQVPGCCLGAGDCNDNNACTSDACVSNACTHTTISCADNNTCTNDSCDPLTGCHNDVDPTCCSTAGDCSDDADPCTDKACIGNRCMQIASGNCCNADVDCTDIDRNPCTDNGPCNLATHRCGGPTPITGPACGTICNPATCQSGTCVADPPKNCNDNNLCTSDICTDDQGCTHVPIDQCCLATGQCNDNNVCTDDTCDLQRNGCDHVVSDPTCTPCVGGDPFECGPRCDNACVGGRCKEGAIDCNDNNSCTTDACDPVSGCTHTTLPGMPDCDDGDVCTDDSCDAATGCVNTQKDSFDGILCRLQDMKAKLAAAGSTGNKPRTVKSVGKKIDKLITKVTAAQSSADAKCAKAKRLITGAAKTLRALQRSVNRAAGHKLDSTLATALALRAGEAATHCDTVKSGLGC